MKNRKYISSIFVIMMIPLLVLTVGCSLGKDKYVGTWAASIEDVMIMTMDITKIGKEDGHDYIIKFGKVWTVESVKGKKHLEKETGEYVIYWEEKDWKNALFGNFMGAFTTDQIQVNERDNIFHTAQNQSLNFTSIAYSDTDKTITFHLPNGTKWEFKNISNANDIDNMKKNCVVNLEKKLKEEQEKKAASNKLSPEEVALIPQIHVVVEEQSENGENGKK